MPPDLEPGWFDPQVNGWAGTDFSAPGLTVDAVRAVADRLAALGTGAFLPTMVTAAPERYAENLPLLAAAARARPKAIPGIHLEGPFINPRPGAVGAHPPRWVRSPSVPAMARLLDLAEGEVRLVTLAPEEPGALELIRFLRERGVSVAVGHSLMRGRDARAAADAGAGWITHFGNGLPGTIDRHDNPLWGLLAEPRLVPMIIADGHHLPADVLRACWRVYGAGGLALVSDAAPVGGMPPGVYEIFGVRARLEPGGRVANLEAPTLAGSSAALAACVAHMAEVVGATPEECRRLGRDNALALLKPVDD